MDNGRYRFIRSLFEQMGFQGAELEMRTRVWLVYASAHGTLTFKGDERIDDDSFVQSHEFFISG